MITNITFESDYRCFGTGDSIDVKPLTLLVGDQGCGKTTLLKLIKERRAEMHMQFSGVLEGVLLFDSEKDNPGVNTLHGNDDSWVYTNKVLSRFNSHGETLLPILQSFGELENSLLLLDEPEAGMSIRSQLLLCDLFRDLLSQGNQLVIATHSTVIMCMFPEGLVDLTTKKSTTCVEFLQNQGAPFCLT